MQRLTLVLIAILCLSTAGMARQDSPLDKTKDILIDNPNQRQKPAATQTGPCRQSMISDPGTAGSPIVVSMEELQTNPESYYGKTVTVDGELHRTFTDKVFTIEDDGFLKDHDVLVISTVPKSEAVVALEDSLEDGKNVRVTGVVRPYDRGKLECAFGPLHLESREGHSFTKNPVLIIDRTQSAKAEPPVQREKPTPVPEAAAPEPEPTPEPAATPEEPAAPAPAAVEEPLPKTAGELPLLALAGLLSLCAAFAMQHYRVD